MIGRAEPIAPVSQVRFVKSLVLCVICNKTDPYKNTQFKPY